MSTSRRRVPLRGPQALPAHGLPSGTLPERGLIAFRSALSAHSTVRIDAATFWAAFAAAFPRHPQGGAERAWLLAALEDAAAHNVIALPPLSGRRWERHAVPPLPVEVERLRAKPVTVGSPIWRTSVWHPLLQWVPALVRASNEEVAFLRRVHDGLVHGTFQILAPFKHRSLALTGDEKRLAQFAKGRLFEPGRLTLELLGAEREVPPLAWTVIRDVCNPRVLVFENAGPSDLAIRVLRAVSRPGWDVVAFGAGKPFCSSVERLTQLAPAVISYVGDLDPDGIAIASAAAATARVLGLTPVMPAPRFHIAMFEAAANLGAPDGWLPDAERQARIRQIMATAPTFAWLPEEAREPLRRIAAESRRIPEEVLSPERMRGLLDR